MTSRALDYCRRTIGLLFLTWLCVLHASAADSTSTNQTPDLTELSLEALMNIEVPKVYSASKFEQKVSEAPSSITVLTSEDIKRHGWRTLAELLESVQGFHVSNDRNYAFLGTRGINLGDFNARILLLVDGHRINNNRTDGAYIDTAFVLDMDLIDRVEIIRGPGSVLYGNNAFFGVINVITRRGGQMTGNGFEASGEYGEFDSYKARLTWGRLFTNGIEALVSGTYYQSDGASRLFYREFTNQNNGFADNLDGDCYVSAFGSVSYGDFSIEGGYNRREKDNPTAQFVGPFGGFDLPGLTTTDERRFLAAKATHSFPEIVDVTARLYYDISDFSLGEPTTNTPSFYKEDDTGEWWGCELQLTKRLWDRHVFTLGAEYRDDFRQHLIISDNAGNIQRDIQLSRQSHGVYFQGDVTVITNLHVNGGVRYDQYGDFDATYSPRVAVIYSPFTTSTFKAIYGTAFRTPNFFELTLSPPDSLSPEQITSYELVYEQEIGRHLRSSVSGFYNEMDDLIGFQDGSFTNFNAITRGMELALQGDWPCGVRARSSYTYQHTTRADGRSQWDSPEHLVKLNVSVPVYEKKIFAGLEYQYTSSRHTVFAQGSSTPQGMSTDGFGIVNFTLFSENLVKNLEFSASIYNLFDCHYSDPSTRFHLQDMIEQDGRAFRFKLTYHF